MAIRPIEDGDELSVFRQTVNEAIAIVDELDELNTFGQVLKGTWLELRAVTAIGNGAGGEVLDTDEGTHLEATATGYNGAPVPNAGRYTWDGTWARWVRIGATGISGLASLEQLALKADQTLVDALAADIAAAATGLTPKGTWDATGGVFPTTTTTGDFYITQVAGTVDGQVFNVGDWVIALIDNPSINTFAANWSRGDYSQVNSDTAFPTISDMENSSLTLDGTYVLVDRGHNGEAEAFEVDADSVLPVDGVLVVDRAEGGNFVSTRTNFDDFQSLVADQRTFPDGTELVIALGVAIIQAVTVAPTFSNVGGQGFRVLTSPSFNERTAINLEELAQYPFGTVANVAGIWHSVDDSLTGAASAGSDLTVDGLAFLDGTIGRAVAAAETVEELNTALGYGDAVFRNVGPDEDELVALDEDGLIPETYLPITPTWQFESAEQVAGTNPHEFVHGLGATPTQFEVFIRCVVADRGYVPGDVVKLSSMEGNGARGMSVWANDTYIGVGGMGSVFLGFKQTGSTGAYTASRWRVFAKANL